MPDELPFTDLMARVRAGDQQAAAELVRRYEPEIRRAVRVRLTDPRMRRAFDSVDIVNSVMGNFFHRAAGGQFDVERPEQLLNLLMKMARNKLLDRVREQQAERRDVRRVQAGDSNLLGGLVADEETPSRHVSDRELMDRVRARLTDEERYLAEQRALGRDWADLGQELGKSPEAVRKQLTRAMERVAGELGLNDN